ncbi:hypothetical protein D9M68_949680 [compost metagenome]
MHFTRDTGDGDTACQHQIGTTKDARRTDSQHQRMQAEEGDEEAVEKSKAKPKQNREEHCAIGFKTHTHH